MFPSTLGSETTLSYPNFIVSHKTLQALENYKSHKFVLIINYKFHEYSMIFQEREYRSIM